MLLCLDVGNSNISAGIFKDGAAEPLFCVKLSSSPVRSVDEYASLLWNLLNLRGISLSDISRCALSSVVPALTGIISEALRQLTASPLLVVGPGIKSGFSIRLDNPLELGADQVANTVGALSLYKPPLIIIDAGTVTTISAVDAEKNYLGGAILPGIRTYADYLKQTTALLPSVEMSYHVCMPKDGTSNDDWLGRNTEDSIRIGLLKGSALMADGFASAYRKQLGENATTIVTGGAASLLMSGCTTPMVEEPHLTLKGLARIAALNQRKKK